MSTLLLVAMLFSSGLDGVARGAAVAPGSDTVAIVRRAPNIDGGTVEGSLRLLTGEALQLRGHAVITSDLVVPGTPLVQQDGHPTFGGIIVGTGSAAPAGYQIKLSGQSALGHLNTRVDAIVLAPVTPPPASTGTLDAHLTQAEPEPEASMSLKNFSQLRNLSLSGQAGAVSVPPGTYGDFSASDHTAFVFGVANATQPSVYNLASITLNGAGLTLAGPVKIVLTRSLSLNGGAVAGAQAHPNWLTILCAAPVASGRDDGGDNSGGGGGDRGDDDAHGGCARGNLKIDGGSSLFALLCAPSCAVTITGHGAVTGFVTCNQLAVTGGGVLHGLANHAPTVNAGTAQHITLPLNAVTLSGVLSDDGLPPCPNGVGLALLWSKVSGPGTVTFANAAAAATTATFSSPGPGSGIAGGQGLYVLRLTVSDSLLSSSADVTVTVNANAVINHAPVVNAGSSQTLRLPARATLTGSATDDGYPNPPGALTFFWSKASGPGTVTFSNATAASTTASFSQAGIYVLTLTASDSLLTGSSNVVVGVLPANQAPLVNAGRDRAVTLPNPLALGGSVSDDGLPLGAGLTVAWSKVSGPGNATFANAADPATSVSFDAPGNYVLRLSASDTQFTSTANANIVVLPATNQPPHVNAGAPQSIVLGASALLSGIVTDDGLPSSLGGGPGMLTYSWSKVSGPGTVIFGNASTLATTAAFSQAGAYMLRLTASDSLLSSSADVSVTVSAANHAPTVSAGPDQAIRLPLNSVTLNGVAFDDGLPPSLGGGPGALAISWSKVSGPGNVAFGAPAKAVTSAAFDQPGVYVLRLTANDSSLSSSANVTVTVRQPNQAPVVNAGPNQAIAMPGLNDLDPSFKPVLLTSTPNAYGFSSLQYYPPENSLIATLGEFQNSLIENIGASGVEAPKFLLPGANQLTVVPDDGGGKSLGGFTAGDVFMPLFGPIARYDSATKTVQGAWATIPGLPELRAAAIDSTGIFGGDMIVLTETGDLWRINSAGTPAHFVQADNAHDYESLLIVPNNAALYGPWAGKILLGRESSPLAGVPFYSVDAQGNLANASLGVNPEQLAIIPKNQDFFGVDGSGSIWTVPAAAFAGNEGEILMLFGDEGTFSHVRWDGTQFQITPYPPILIFENAAFAPKAFKPTPLPGVILAGSASDDGQPLASNGGPGALTYSWSKRSGPGDARFADSAKLNTSVTFTQGGIYVLTLSADDGELQSSSAVTIYVNQAPVVNAGPAQTVALPGAVQLNGSIIDDGLPGPPGPPAAISSGWTKASGPGKVAFSAPAYDAANDFTTSSNPAGPLPSNAGWSYGAEASAGGTFVPYSTPAHIRANAYLPDYDSWQGGPGNASGGAQIYFNPTDSYQANSQIIGTVPPNSLVLQPGTGGSSVLRWTAPAPGNYVVLGKFQGLEFANSDVAVLYNSATALFTANIQPSSAAQPATAPFSFSRAFGLGDTLDFIASVHPTALTQNYAYNDAVVIAATILPPGNAQSASATFSDSGTYVLRLSASDSQLSNSAYATVVVQAANKAPWVDAGPDQAFTLPSGTQPAVAALAGKVQDDGYPVGSAITISWSKVSGPGNVVFLNAASPATTASFDAPGHYVLRLSANDTQLTGSDDVAITVFQQNRSIAVTADYDHAAVYPNAFALAGTAESPGTLPATPLNVVWSKIAGPGSAIFANPNALNTTVTFGAIGNYKMRLTVSDGVASASADVSIAVNYANKAPAVYAGASQTLLPPANSVALNGFAEDDGLPNPPGALLYSWSQVLGPASAVFNSANTPLTQATFTAPGTYVLRLTASDSLLSGSADATVVVPIPNAIAPLVILRSGEDYGSNSITLPNSMSLLGAASETANPNATFTYGWNMVYGPGAVAFNAPGAPSSRAAFSAPGKYVIRFTAHDGVSSNSADIIVSVHASYLPPLVQAADLSVTWPSALQLSGYISQAGSSPAQSMTWSWVAGPGQVAFANPLYQYTAATFSAPGVYILRFTVVDAVASTSADATITVKPAPVPPFVDAGFDSTVLVLSTFELKGIGSTGMTAGWSIPSYNGSPNIPFLVGGPKPGGQPGELVMTLYTEGTYVFRFTVTDPATQLQSFKDVTVIALADAPPVVLFSPGLDGPAIYATVQAPTALHGSVSFSNPTVGDPQIVWAKALGNGTVNFSNAHTADTVATFTAIGHYTLTLSANDGAYSNSAQVDVYVSAAANRPPVVDAGPPQTIAFAQSATLSGSATDDGLPQRTLAVLWSKVSGPGSVAFADPSAPTTTASFNAPGAYLLRLSADDANIVSNSETTVTVLAQNQAPIVSAGPNRSGSANAPLILNGSVSDDGLPSPPSALTLKWSQLSGPGNAAFANPNAAVTSATFDAPGAYTLQLSASDSLLTATALVSVIVTPPVINKPPVVSAGPNQTVRLPQNSAILSGSATDDGLPPISDGGPGVLTIAWTKISGPGTVAFANPASATTTAAFSMAGKYVLCLSASDGALASVSKVNITLLNPITASPPSVSIDSPADGSEITKPTDILATIACANPVDWVLDYALNTDEDNAANLNFVTFASGSGNVASAKLGTFDPTLLLNGTYQIRATATDSSGQSAAAAISLVARKNMKVGNFAIAFNDLSVPVAGIPIQIVRSYDSRDARSGDFGAGWQLAVRDVRLEKTVNLGKQWFQSADFTGFLGAFSMHEGRAHKVTITFPDGKVYEFQGSLSPSQQQAGTITAGIYTFTPIAPTLGALTVVGSNDILVNGAPDEQNPTVPVTLNGLNGALFNPTLFKLTTVEGAQFIIDQKLGLVSMTGLNGNTVTFSANGIVSSTGKSIVFDRDTQGRIVKITDPAGQAMTYAYDASGNLISFTDRVGNATGFTFDNTHKLLSIVDPRGITPIRNIYGPDGRLLSHTDAFGKQIIYTHDIAGRTETVTDRLGHATVHAYDDDGNVLSTLDAEGGLTQMAYDARDNMLSSTDALNRTTHYEYDPLDNKTAEVDNLGQRSEYTYDGARRMLTMKDPLGRVTTNAYDFKENLLQTVDPLGSVTKYDYNYQAPHGQPVKLTDALDNVWKYTYDYDGNRLASIDPQGNIATAIYGDNNVLLSHSVARSKPGGGIETLTTSHEYDTQNRPVKTTLPDGTFTSMTYNSIGKLAAMTDQLGRVTAHEYNELGFHVKTTYPDGLFEATTYDAEGRRLTSLDRAGRAMTYVYDKVGRTTQIVYPDNTSTVTIYDLSGQVAQSADARGNVTKYDYDAIGRRSKITDANNKVTQFTFDANGNQKAIVDALNHSMSNDYDLDNRRVNTTFNDGTFATSEYDSLGRKTAEVDQAGKRTQYGYDSLGRLTQVTDAIGNITKYEYNEIGQQTGQIDALNRRTAYEFDPLGRRVKRTLPLGQFEQYSYNSVGSLTNRIDFNGKISTYVYDNLNRLTQKIPDPSFGAPSVVFAYTPTGRRASMSDASGFSVYTYNSRDWLVSKQTPEGTLNYGYDTAGNLANTRTNHVGGASMDYSFDTLNRLSAALDNNVNGSTNYAYDDVGNLQSFVYPNGTSHAFAYDALNRLTNLMGKAGGNTTIANYHYTLGASGNRIGLSELSGRAAAYAYDDIYRLIGETISGVAQSAAISYVYDAVGNRMTRSSTLPTVPAATQSYNSNDWLDNDTYDNNGNTKQSAAVAYSYDFENRIVGTSNGTQIIYDGDGNRVGETVAGATTRYLIDTNNLSGYAQVVEELYIGGAVKTVYSFGHELISIRIPGTGVAYYGFDGHGSVRYLTNPAGQITDTYDYDAFGILIARTGTTPNPYMYCGEQFDPDLGLYYLRARYMNPGSGRFWTMDDDEADGVDPIELHKYLYVHANPFNNIDPTGHGLNELMASISAQVIIFTITHPTITAILGFVIGVLIPDELAIQLQDSGIPPLQALGVVSRGEVRLFKLATNNMITQWIYKNFPSLTGKLSRELGLYFERIIGSLLLGAERQPTTVGNYKADYLWRNVLIEVKSGFRLLKDDVPQLEALGVYAKKASKDFVYIFFERPTKHAVDLVEKNGGNVIYFYER